MSLTRFLPLICILTITFISCDTDTTRQIPMPTEKTSIHHNGEDENSFNARQQWIDLMHGGPASLWRTIEAKNQENKYNQWLQMNPSLRSGDEIVAGGLISGKWSEKGSNNNAGNIMVADYDAEEDIIYAVGGGGPMFKGDFSGFGWEVVNDKLRFSTDLLKVFNMGTGKKRIISAVNGIPHYSEDDGKKWIKSTGVIATSDGWVIYDSEVTQDGKIFFLGKKDYWANIRVYVSYDMGKTYASLKSFTTSDTRNIALTRNAINDDIYVIEQLGGEKSQLYKFNKTVKALDIISENQPIAFGTEGRANLQAVTYKDTIHLYLFREDKKLYVSKDEGKNWKYLSNLPTEPWDVALYVCPSDPRKMIYGEVDAYRSINGGGNWTRISAWWEYYGDITNKLHADIMTVREFKDKSGKSFLLNGNHGGLYYSDNYGSTHTNIGLYNLNVSQYYDVRTYPSNPYYVFAGSQDQGQQRGTIDDDGPAELFQNISGDYGHIEFTGNGKSLWSVYPGGSIGFYSDPLSQNTPIEGYEIKSENETVWIPPIMPGPDPSKNIIYAAGGSTSSTSTGSYLIQLEYVNNKINATQLPYNFAGSGGQISAMAIDPMDKSRWYVATTNGKFYRSLNGGQNFTRTAEFLSEAHYLYGSCILPSAINPDVVFLSGNGYNYKPVYRSVDGGKTFSDFSNGLPKTMVFNIVANEDESLIFAATEAGPYVYVTAKGRWYDMSGVNTPNQTYWSVEYVAEIKTARFATYGRGIWDFEVKDILTSNQDIATVEEKIRIFPNPASDVITITTQIPYLFHQVCIFDQKGRLVHTQTTDNVTPISIRHLSKGIYIVEVKSGKITNSKKLVVL